MGYTHYWRRPAQIHDIAFAQWAEDCRKILAALPAKTATAGGYHSSDPLILAWEYDVPGRLPEISPSLVRFNGTGTSAEEDLGHETFYVARVLERESWQKPKGGLYFEFCKTARKPYDLAVVACLSALKLRCPRIELTSDGDRGERIEGIRLAEKVLGEPVPLWDGDRRGPR